MKIKIKEWHNMLFKHNNEEMCLKIRDFGCKSGMFYAVVIKKNACSELVRVKERDDSRVEIYYALGRKQLLYLLCNSDMVQNEKRIDDFLKKYDAYETNLHI
jgi:hypothetical protein